MKFCVIQFNFDNIEEKLNALFHNIYLIPAESNENY